jgi:mRNA interferase MazF
MTNRIPAPKRGEVWRAELDPTRGSEQSKTRPVVVMNCTGVGRASMRVSVPIVHSKPVHDGMVWCVPLAPSNANGLTKDSTADASQIRALDTSRFLECIGTLQADESETIAAAVTLCVSA